MFTNRAGFGTTIFYADHLTFFEGLRKITKPLCGVTVTLEAATSSSSRMTTTRIVTGGALAGPAGAIIGGLAKKRQGGSYIIRIVGPDFVRVETVKPDQYNSAVRFQAKAETLIKQACTSAVA